MWRVFLVAVFVLVLVAEFCVRMGGADWSAVQLGEPLRPRSLEWAIMLAQTYPWSIGTGLACALLAWLPGRFLREPAPH
jgi:hypothetical protein